MSLYMVHQGHSIIGFPFYPTYSVPLLFACPPFSVWKGQNLKSRVFLACFACMLWVLFLPWQRWWVPFDHSWVCHPSHDLVWWHDGCLPAHSFGMPCFLFFTYAWREGGPSLYCSQLSLPPTSFDPALGWLIWMAIDTLAFGTRLLQPFIKKWLVLSILIIFLMCKTNLHTECGNRTMYVLDVSSFSTCTNKLL